MASNSSITRLEERAALRPLAEARRAHAADHQCAGVSTPCATACSDVRAEREAAEVVFLQPR